MPLNPRWAACAVAVLTSLPAPALARAQEVTAPSGPVEIRESRDITSDIADDVERVFNGAGVRRVGGDFTVAAGTEIASDLAVLGGRLVVAGRVTGRVATINADVVLEPTAHLEKDLTILGGRLEAREGGQILGDVRVFRNAMTIEPGPDRVLVYDRSEEGEPIERPARRRMGFRGNLRLVSARTYNRVEGLPLLLGPVLGREFRWGRIEVDAFGILRSADRFRLSSENLGHSVAASVRIGRTRGVRLGGELFDVVAPVESWHLSDSEVGIASFLLHRDYRDYSNRHGGAVFASAFFPVGWEVSLSYGDERWAPLNERDPWTLFRDTQTWRANPTLDAASVHLVGAAVRYDTRNDPEDPWTGWHVQAQLERGYADMHVAGPSSILSRPGTLGPSRAVYDRGFVDIRRYNRVSQEGQLNLRLVAGGWLGGDELPLQRRFSLGGAGSLPGYDFRRRLPGTDYLTCSSTAPPPAQQLVPPGTPAECERFLLAQVEYRGDIRADPWGVLGALREQRRFGWGRRAEWVVFADAGRGWLVGPRVGDLRYPAGRLPPIGTLRADVGVGLRLDDLGIYLAKSVTDSDALPNLYVRLRPRF